MAAENSQSQKIQELQQLEQNLQALSYQKQAVQVELNEVNNAILELERTNDEVYRILSGIMLRADKLSLVKELSEKKKILEVRITSFEKQEKLLGDRAKNIRAELNTLLKKNN